MFPLPKMMDPAEYKKEWEAGLHQSEYNSCRFADDKLAYGEAWLKRHVPYADFLHPKNLVDRICNYKLYDRDLNKRKWVDKISSHWNLNEAGMPELAIEPVMYSRSYLSEADWDSLPNGKYIIKMAHGSGWNIKFEKTDDFDPTYIQQKVWEWYNLNFAYMKGYEWQYEHVTPGYVIQPDLGQLMNWEFWCEEGKIIGVNLNRKLAKNFRQSIVWCDEFGDAAKFDDGPAIRYYMTKSEKEVLEKMKPYVLKLAAPFKFVRVDLYHINNEIKFSELTFSPHGGDITIRSYT